jgi:tyrosyl-tRNA synthetase
MGKSASGAVWLNGELFSPYDFWQYFRNTEDADVGKWLKIFTRLSLDEIAKLEALGGSELNEAKKILATEVTAIVHGREAAVQSAATAKALFESGATLETLPTVLMPMGEWTEGRSNSAIAVASGLVSSGSEARRKIAEGALRINDVVVTDPNGIMLYASDLYEDTGAFKVQLGKKKTVLVKPV